MDAQTYSLILLRIELLREMDLEEGDAELIELDRLEELKLEYERELNSDFII
jgi:hypothetical protein